MNIFDALNVFYREDTISDFLVNCFKSSSEFLIRFLQEAKIQTQGDTVFHIDTRVGLGKGIGTPDIVIRAVTKDQVKVIIIENKMGASEGNEQTNRYESFEARKRIAEKFDLTLELVEFHFVFLALDVTASPRNSKFIFLNYNIFLDGVWPLPQGRLEMIFNDFQQKLNDFYKPLDDPYESIETDMKMDSMQCKICWQKIFYETFVSQKELVLEWGEVGGSGRSNFIFLVSKQNWRSSQSYKEVGLSHTFYVHVDTYINLLDKGSRRVKEMGIRFESFPYEPHDKIKQSLGYECFRENKSIFDERLYNRAISQGIKATRKNTKLLSITIPVEGLTVRETMQNIKMQLMLIGSCIDQVIGEMKSESLLK